MSGPCFHPILDYSFILSLNWLKNMSARFSRQYTGMKECMCVKDHTVLITFHTGFLQKLLNCGQEHRPIDMVHPKNFNNTQICFSVQPLLTLRYPNGKECQIHIHTFQNRHNRPPPMKTEAAATALVGSRSNAKLDWWSAQWSSWVFLYLPSNQIFFYTVTLQISNCGSDQGRTDRN